MWFLPFPLALLLCDGPNLVRAHEDQLAIRSSHTELNVHVDDSVDQTALLPRGHNQLRKRQTCGAGVGSCPTGLCCSEAGYCGTTTDYCKGPGCQYAYSDSCDASKAPPGPSTEDIPRPKIGAVPYGKVITTCTTPGTVALTFDDGPWQYTSELLDVLAARSVRATFFITGNNLGKGRIDDGATPWPALLRRMHAAGHQLASHTWTHQDLSAAGPDGAAVRARQVLYNEMAFRNLFGWFPAYLRPPYASCPAAGGCLGDLARLGYHVVDFDVDTKDYENDDAARIQRSKDLFAAAVATGSGAPPVRAYIELSHDTHRQTVVNLTEFMVQTLEERGYRAVPVGTCLGDPEENWYRDASETKANKTGD